MQKFLFKDSSGKKSLTATTFVWGCLVVNLKLIFSGMVLFGSPLAEFGGGDYAAAMGALGAIYVMRRSTDPERRNPTAKVEGDITANQ
jgi:hypothetical protein